MTIDEAKKYLINISYEIGTIGIEYLSEKDGERVREAIKTLTEKPKYKILTKEEVAKRIGERNIFSCLHYVNILKEFEQLGLSFCEKEVEK